MNITELALRFAFEHHPELADQITAFGRCDTMTHAFIDFCESLGYEGMVKRYSFDARNETHRNPDPVMYNVVGPRGEARRNESDWTMCEWHCIVETEECFIDFTARQYSKTNPFPAFIHKSIQTGPHADIDDTQADLIAKAAKAGA